MMGRADKQEFGQVCNGNNTKRQDRRDRQVFYINTTCVIKVGTPVLPV